MINLYGHLTVSQLASFVYRWYILHWQIPSRRTMGIVTFLVSIPTLLSFFIGTVSYSTHFLGRKLKRLSGSSLATVLT